MKKKLFRVAVLLAMLFASFSYALFTPKAHAMPKAPAQTSNCSPTYCYSFGYWNGLTRGAYVLTTISEPSTSIKFTRYIELVNTGNGNWARTGMANYSVCGLNPANGPYELYYRFSNGGCMEFGISDEQDANVAVSFQISWYLSNGGGVIVEWGVNDNTDWDLPCSPGSGSPACFVAYQPNIWNQILMEELVQGTITNHQVWGVVWYQSSWFDGTYWNTQARDFDSRRSQNPPQFYWDVVPDKTNNGGWLYSCDYGGTNQTTCNIGS